MIPRPGGLVAIEGIGNSEIICVRCRVVRSRCRCDENSDYVTLSVVILSHEMTCSSTVLGALVDSTVLIPTNEIILAARTRCCSI